MIPYFYDVTWLILRHFVKLQQLRVKNHKKNLELKWDEMIPKHQGSVHPKIKDTGCCFGF